MTKSSTSINTAAQYTFQFSSIALPLPVGTIIYMTLPTSMSVYSDSSQTTVILNTATGTSPISTTLSFSILAYNKIKITNVVPSSSYYADEKSTIKFSVLKLKNPGSAQPSGTFTIEFYESDYPIMSLTSGLTVTSTSGALTGFTVTPNSAYVRKDVSYSFTVTTTNDVSSSGQI